MSQTKLPALTLLLTAFVLKNQEIYKDDPAKLASFYGLTLDDLTVSEITKVDGVHSATIESRTRNFEGPDQKWRPVALQTDNLFTLAEEAVLENKAAAEAKTVPGVYGYLDTEGEIKYVVLVAAGEELAARATALLVEALKYEIPSDHITAGETTLVVDGDTIVGEIEFLVSAPAPIVLPEGPIMDLG